ncbi:hypothetical protein IU500_23960 [Nocardia terpenica]|uniref:hypothetical protein n=1 Tax=Nocardia terpenica TaxID=455432 RepID=UPI0018930E5E|nr:hypothetical protein [Nocardia terpenica]MBF6063724.1 hypothetical protein [Nocardia terpenica]MBF6107100.1 hypothetical protein [Nocardia terpenica]MBF6114273.1 hypothetical protein [Nocardia terpenica]MBF6121640.1 hypothetical protein [Nocardia terpenica]MBF6154055.1 hypothetical protein [Nocardia terpenica]
MVDNQDVTLWKFLSGEAQAGRLDLDPSVSQDCLTACENELKVYRDARTLLGNVAHVSGFGDFPASDELAKMLGAKAIGGEGDFDSALAKHIEVLGLIRDTIKHSVERLVDNDKSQADRIAGLG